MQLYFIRHGQSANNLLYERSGSGDGRESDPELTDYGRRQAKLLAQFLVAERSATPAVRDAWPQNIDGYHLTHIYASPMIRAMDTAAPIAQAFGITPQVWPDLHEVGGMWNNHPKNDERIGEAGPPRAFFEKRYPQFTLPDSFDDNGWWNKPHERFEESIERAKRVWQRLHTLHGDTADRVAFVSHGMFYNALMAVLLEMPLPPKIWFLINNTALTRIDFGLSEWGDTMRLAYQNRVDFLPPELVT
jgi:2,3-bisphosphoglycerate-dependent phosphoglycerate mutase